MMLACLDLGSRTLVAVEHAGVFGINVLAADQAELARRFSTKDPIRRSGRASGGRSAPARR